jgi:hypothetical protein
MAPLNSKNTKPAAKAEPAPPAPEVKAQKGGKKVEQVASTPAPVSKAVPAKKVVAKEEPVPVKEEPVSVKEEPVAQKAGGKKAAPAKEAVSVKEVKKAVPAKKGVAAATKGEKAAKQPKATKAANAGKKEEEEEGEDSEKGVRSFKVQLPGSEDYAGRFTGLTPYQAANKALSKYFRENKQAKSEITFSIKESTRGSKRSTYTYNGKREKLSIPVKYSIKGADGAVREITKEYKNKLTKVKKAETKEVVA